MEFTLNITYNPEQAAKDRLGIEFEGDGDMPFVAVLQGIKTFLDTAEKLQGTEPAVTLGHLFPEVDA